MCAVGLSGLVKSKAVFVFVLAAAFFVYQLFLLLNSVPVSFRMYSGYLTQFQAGVPFWVWFCVLLGLVFLRVSRGRC